MERTIQKSVKGINKHKKVHAGQLWQGMVEAMCKKAHVDPLTTDDFLKEIGNSKVHKRSHSAA